MPKISLIAGAPSAITGAETVVLNQNGETFTTSLSSVKTYTNTNVESLSASLGSAAYQPASAFLQVGNNFSDIGDLTTAKANLALSASDISDSTAAGRALLTAANAAAQITALGAATPATVAAQITAATASGFLENPSGLIPAFNGFMGFDQNSSTWANSAHYVSVVGFGDSMAAPYAGPLVEELTRMYGVGAWLTSNLGSPSANSGGGFTFTGGASVPAGSYSLTPGTNWINMPSGSTATHTLPRTTESITKASGGDTGISGQKINTWHGYRSLPGGCVKVAVLIATAPGAGTLDITVAQDQYSNLTASVNTNAAAGFISQEFAPVDRHAPITVTLSASVATCTVIGAIYFSAEGGVIYWDAAEGGSTMEQQLASLSGGAFKPAFAGLFSYLNTRMVFHHQRAANDTNALANYDTFFDAFDTLGSGDGNGITQLVLGELPLLSEGAITIATHNAALRTKAATRGYPFVDLQKLTRNQAQIAAAGWVGSAENDVHFYGPTQRFVGGWLAHQFHHLRSALSFSQPGYGFIARMRERNHYEMATEALTDRIILRNGYTLVSAVTSGAGYGVAMDNTRGLVVTGGAAIGYAKQEIGSLGWGGGVSTPAINVHQLDYSVVINGCQSFSIVANQRAWFAVGLRAGNSHTSVATITVRSFGLEFAFGDDVGAPDGSTGRLAARLWMHDGTSIIYSRWFRFGISGDAAAALGGHSIIIEWDLLSKTLTALLAVPSGSAANRGLMPMASITNTTFAAASTHGAFVYAGIGAVSAPATTGFVAAKNIILRGGNIAYPFRQPS